MELFLHFKDFVVSVEKPHRSPKKKLHEPTQEAQGEGVDEQGRVGPQSRPFGAYHRPDREGEELSPGDQEENHLGIGFAA